MPVEHSGDNPLGVMLLDDQPERARLVEQSLLQAGFKVVALLTSASGLLHQIDLHRPDVILIDLESPDRDVLDSLSVANAHNPLPVIMFSEEGDEDFMSAAVDAGVTAYQGLGINPDIVKPVIDVAMGQFQYYRQLREELHDARAELEDHHVIERAKAALSHNKGISRDAAYALMRKLSMDHNRTLVDIARGLLVSLPASGDR